MSDLAHRYQANRIERRTVPAIIPLPASPISTSSGIARPGTTAKRVEDVKGLRHIHTLSQDVG
jgi:hypothetical protein